MNTVNVAAHLARLAAAEPDRVALFDARRRTSRTFRALHEDSDALARGLQALGVAPGTRVALMVPPSLDFFAMAFALFKLAAVPVLIDPGMGVANLGTCLNEAEPEAFIGVPKAHLGRILYRWAAKSIRVTVNVGFGRFLCTRSIAKLRDPGPFVPPDVSPADVAAILFTSGSTGVAKGAVYTHGIFAAQVDLLKQVYGIQPGEVDLCTFPLFALFGPALGMTCIIPDMDPRRPASIDPMKTIAAIRTHGVTNLFGSPAAIRRLAERAELGVMSPRLRRVISAGAPASATTLARFRKMLPPGVQVFTPYGATEALPVANIGSDEILDETRALTESGRGICIGRPVPGVTVRVIRITDGPIPAWDESLCVPPGEVGEFVVRGPIVTPRYHNREAATTLAKIADGAEVLHRMGDVGYFDAQGRLWFCGRKSHRVETAHGTLFTDMVEPIFNAVPGVSRTALVGVRRGEAHYPVMVCELDDTMTVSANVWDELRERAANFPPVEHVATFLPYVGRFPVDVRHNSKIFREKLAAWADAKLGPSWNGG